MSGAPPPATWPMLRALVGVGLLCGLVIVAVYEITAPMIARNRAEALGAAVFEAVDGATDSAAFRWTGDGFALDGGADSAGERVFAGYDASGRLVGVAIEAAGMGYQDVIKVLYGYAPERRAIVGLVVLESRETPGLGDKIETDAAFRANFEALDVSLAASGDRLANPIESVASGARTAPYQIDSITGATISSVAIAEILAASAELWIPRIEARLKDFAGRGRASRPAATEARP